MFLPKSGGNYCGFYSITLRIKLEKIDNEAIETPKKSIKVNKIDAVEDNIGRTNHDNEIERVESDNKNDSESSKNGTINSEVINTYTDYRIKKDYPTSPEM